MKVINTIIETIASKKLAARNERQTNNSTLKVKTGPYEPVFYRLPRRCAPRNDGGRYAPRNDGRLIQTIIQILANLFLVQVAADDDHFDHAVADFFIPVFFHFRFFGKDALLFCRWAGCKPVS